MLGWGAARPGQVLPHRVLQMSRLSDVAGPGWILLQGRRVLLHAGLSGSLRHQVLPLRTIRRRGSGHRSGEDVPQQLLHLRPLQVIAVFLSFFPFVTQPKISFLETHKSNFGWMPSGSLTGRNTLFYISIWILFRYCWRCLSCGFLLTLFLREAVKRKWSTVPNCLSADFLLPEKSPTAYSFLFLKLSLRVVVKIICNRWNRSTGKDFTRVVFCLWRFMASPSFFFHSFKFFFFKGGGEEYGPNRFTRGPWKMGWKPR